MEYVIDVPEYVRGDPLRLAWDDGFEIEMIVGATDVAIKANPAGLISLARHLLTLAQDSVRDGTHVHLTADEEMSASVDLILERTSYVEHQAEGR
jgi:hypothetical protein